MNTNFYQITKVIEPFRAPEAVERKNIVLQSVVDGKYGDTHLCCAFGEIAKIDVQPGDIVVASIKAKVSEYNGNLYQDNILTFIRKV